MLHTPRYNHRYNTVPLVSFVSVFLYFKFSKVSVGQLLAKLDMTHSVYVIKQSLVFFRHLLTLVYNRHVA